MSSVRSQVASLASITAGFVSVFIVSGKGFRESFFVAGRGVMLSSRGQASMASSIGTTGEFTGISMSTRGVLLTAMGVACLAGWLFGVRLNWLELPGVRGWRRT